MSCLQRICVVLADCGAVVHICQLDTSKMPLSAVPNKNTGCPLLTDNAVACQNGVKQLQLLCLDKGCCARDSRPDTA